MRRFPSGAVQNHGDDRFTLTFVHDYPHPIAEIWQAITDPAITRRWLAETKVDLQPVVQFDIGSLNNGDEGQPNRWATSVIQRLQPPALSERGLLRWELEDTSSASARMIFTHEFTGDAK